MTYFRIVRKNLHIATIRAYSRAHAVKLAYSDGLTGKLYARELNR